MKTLVAIDPIEPKGQAFDRLCEAVNLFQENGLISETTIASTIHASLYIVPFQWYRDMKDQFSKEVLDRIESACSGRIPFCSAKVLQSNSSGGGDRENNRPKWPSSALSGWPFGRRLRFAFLILRLKFGGWQWL